MNNDIDIKIGDLEGLGTDIVVPLSFMSCGGKRSSSAIYF